MLKKLLLTISVVLTLLSFCACGAAKVDLENEDLYGTWYYYGEDNVLQVSSKFNEDGTGHFHSVYGGITTADYDFDWENADGTITVTWNNEGTETSYKLTAKKNGDDPVKLYGDKDLEFRRNE